MKIAIFGDIHGNLEALEAVLRDAEECGAESFACLGDIVGYGADPAACLERVRGLECQVVKGNHDAEVATDVDLRFVNPMARSALLWTREQLSAAEREWLDALPLKAVRADITYVHASLLSPSQWHYVRSEQDAGWSMGRQETPLCFHGHTHVPRIFQQDVENLQVDTREAPSIEVVPGMHFFVNVGSVGQPRDGDAQASYAIFDEDRKIVELKRVAYDIASAQDKILAAGLPEQLADRLALGR